MSRFISWLTALTASPAPGPPPPTPQTSSYPFPGRGGAGEGRVATSLPPYVFFASAPAKFVYHVCVWTMSASIGSETMFTLNERTWNAFANLGPGAARPWTLGRYRQTLIGRLGGGPDSGVRTCPSNRFDSAGAMYFAWTPAPP